MGFQNEAEVTLEMSGPTWGSQTLPPDTPSPPTAGNAGMATAYAARRLGIPATIVVPSTTPALTIERLKDEGATVEVVGEVSADPAPPHRGRQG